MPIPTLEGISEPIRPPLVGVLTSTLVCVQEYNLKYVDLIEEQLNEALTTYRKPVDGDNYVRRSNQRREDGLQSPDGTRGRGLCTRD